MAGALLLVVVGRDLVIKPEGADQPGAIRLLQLFTYNYRRAWPDSLDFSAVLAGFTAIAIVLSLALAVKAVRRHAVAAMCAFAFVWGLWGLDVYMQKTAQHWGQHEVIAAYYANRASPDEHARRLPDELEGRELLHRQPHPGVRLDGRRRSRPGSRSSATTG